jgi:hypothetical protein
VHSLAHLRMRKQLAQFLELPVDASWDRIQTTSRNRDYETFCRELIKQAGIQIILFDDGIINESCYPISWHDRLTPFPNKRIVRIERLFEVSYGIAKYVNLWLTQYTNLVNCRYSWTSGCI